MSESSKSAYRPRSAPGGGPVGRRRRRDPRERRARAGRGPSRRAEPSVGRWRAARRGHPGSRERPAGHLDRRPRRAGRANAFGLLLERASRMHGLADVEVEERTDEISILLWVGDVPEPRSASSSRSSTAWSSCSTRRSSRVARSWTCHRAEACAGGSHIARPSGTLGGGAGPGAPDRHVIGRPGFGTGGTEPRGAARRERMGACRARR